MLVLDDVINVRDLLKIHMPYHESDHVLNIAYNLLAGGAAWTIGTAAQRRSLSDALGARRIPDPTTAGDFCSAVHQVVHLSCCRKRSTKPGSRSGGNSPSRSSRKRSSTATVRWLRRRRVQSRHGHQLRGKVGLPSAADLAGQRPSRCTCSIAAAIAPATKTRPAISTGAIALCRLAGFARSRSAATPTFRRPSISTLGRRKGWSSSSASTPCRTCTNSRKTCRKPPGNPCGLGLQSPRGTTPAAAERQGQDCPRARV